jgi:AraC-like DNA-binding protein/mannose-6-phosphate isomerase-like protein (cupin superfamily)
MGQTRYEIHQPFQDFLDHSGDARFVYARNHVLPADPDLPQPAAKLLYVTASKDENDWNSMMHNHHFLELFYVLSGSGMFYVGNQSIAVSPCDLVIVNPHVEHTEKSGAQPMEYIVLGIEGLQFSFDDPEMQYSVTNYSHMKNDIQVLFGMLVSELHEDQPYKAEVCQSVLSILLIQIARSSQLTAHVTPTQQVSSAIDSVRQYIDANFKLPLTLDLLSERCHLSKYYLVHHFTETFGVSPINYLLQKRIDESKHLLEMTDHSLFQIAQVVGFSSPSYFSQSFRRSVGLSPLEYRKREKSRERNN